MEKFQNNTENTITTSWLFVGSTIILVGLYSYFHGYAALLLVIVLVWVCAVVVCRLLGIDLRSIMGIFEKKESYGWQLVFWFIGLSALLMLILALNYLGYPTDMVLVLSMAGRLAITTTGLVAALALLLCLCVGLGSLISKRTGLSQTFKHFSFFEQSLIYSAIGSSLVMFITFGLLAGNIFSTLSAGIVVGILAIASFWESAHWLRRALTVKLELVSQAKSSIERYSVIIWLTVTVIFFVSAQRVLPIINDDIAVYYSVPILYSSTGGLIAFVDSISAAAHSIGLMWHAFVWTIFPEMVVFMQSYIFLLGTVGGVYVVAKRYTSTTYAHLAALLAMVTPWNAFFIHSQKMIFLISFFSVLAIWLLLLWLRRPQNKPLLLLSAFFAGVTASIKLTGLVLILVIGLVLVVFIYKKTISLFQGVQYGIVVGLVLTPMFVANSFLYGSILGGFDVTTQPTQEVFFDSQERVTMIDLYKHSRQMHEENQIITQLTRKSQTSNNVLINALWQIWNTVMNQKGIAIKYVQVGPFVLLFLMWGLYYFFANRWYKKIEIQALMSVIIFGGLVWLVLGKQRPWYGIGVFYMIFPLAALCVYELQKQRLVQVIAMPVVYSFVIMVVLTGMSMSDERALAAIGGAVSKQEVYSEHYWYPFAQAITHEIAQNPATRVLAIPTQEIAFVPNAHNHIIATSYGFYWSQVVTEAVTLDAIHDILTKQGITHIFYSKMGILWLRSFQTETTQVPQTLDHAYDVLEQYLEVHGEVLLCAEVNCLYKIK